MKLTLELIPLTSFFKNFRNLFPDKWDVIRKTCYKNANYKCEICEGKGSKWPVECREIWDYNFDTKTQKLVRLIALCPKCHMVKHWGLSQLRGLEDLTYEHLCRVNKIDMKTAQSIVQKGFKDWQKKNTINWKLDISYIKDNFK